MAVDSYARQLAQMAVSNGGTNNNGGSASESDKTVSSNIIDINITDYPESNPFDLETLKPGMFIFIPDYQTAGYIKAISPGDKKYHQSKVNNSGYGYLCLYLGNITTSINKHMEFLAVDPKSPTGSNSNNPSFIKFKLLRMFVSNNSSISLSMSDCLLHEKALACDSSDTITAQHTYNVLPKSSVIPTNDEHFVNKAYVDSAITGVLEGEY